MKLVTKSVDSSKNLALEYVFENAHLRLLLGALKEEWT